MKTDAVFKRAYNDTVDLLARLKDRDPLPAESSLSARLGVSRTTVRKVLAALAERGIVQGEGRGRIVRRPDRKLRRFPHAETVSTAAQVESRFMEWMLKDNARPGMPINELDLARRFGVATTVHPRVSKSVSALRADREAAQRGVGVSRLHARLRPRAVRDPRDVRAPLSAGLRLAAGGLVHWQHLDALRQRHLALLGDIEFRYHDFSELDSRFHRLVNSAAPNRFIDGFYDVITLIFHYHYQWNKHDERQRNEVAIREHLTYIDALVGRDAAAVEKACRAHLASAKETLIRSTATAAAA